MRVRMLANVVGHEGLLAEGRVLECFDPRVGDWLARGLAEAVDSEQPADPPVEAALAPALEGPPAPAAHLGSRKRRH